MQEKLLGCKELMSGYNHQYVADLLGIHRETYRLKKKGEKEFTQSEIKGLMTLFKLTPTEVVNIFFTNTMTNSHNE